MNVVKIGDRVKWAANNSRTGTITDIKLWRYAFQVKWDNGESDWHRGDFLSQAEETKITKAQELRVIADKANEEAANKTIDEILKTCVEDAQKGNCITSFRVNLLQKKFVIDYLEKEGFQVGEDYDMDCGEDGVCLLINW